MPGVSSRRPMIFSKTPQRRGAGAHAAGLGPKLEADQPATINGVRARHAKIGCRQPVGPAALAGLSLAIGVALAQLLTALGIAGVGLKWPNDLLCGGRKLGGILIELQGDTQGPCWAVAGIGLNVNMDVDDGPSIDQPWTSLLRLGGRSWDRTALAAQVVSSVRQVMAEFPGAGLAPWLDAYAQFDLLAGCPVHVDWAGERICGVARGIDASGALLVDCDGERRALWGGEVTVRAARGSAV